MIAVPLQFRISHLCGRSGPEQLGVTGLHRLVMEQKVHRGIKPNNMQSQDCFLKAQSPFILGCKGFPAEPHPYYSIVGDYPVVSEGVPKP